MTMTNDESAVAMMLIRDAAALRSPRHEHPGILTQINANISLYLFKLMDYIGGKLDDDHILYSDLPVPAAHENAQRPTTFLSR
jgi:hypothetical protein